MYFESIYEYWWYVNRDILSVVDLVIQILWAIGNRWKKVGEAVFNWILLFTKFSTQLKTQIVKMFLTC